MSWSIEIEARAGPLHLDLSITGDARPVAVVGPNGSGKTTLLRVVAGAHPAGAGRIVVDGDVWFDAVAGVDLAPDERSVGFVPQGFGLFPHLTVLGNVAFGASRDAAAQSLADLGCAHLADRRPAALSGGEQQRVALARALVTDPALLLLDEPLSALDALTRGTIRTVLAHHLRHPPRPTLVVTHDVRDVVALDAEVVVLDAGAVVQRGSVDALRRAPATPFVREFLGPDRDR